MATCGFISVATTQAGYTSGSSGMSIFTLVFISVTDGGHAIVCCVVEANCKIVSEERGLEDICLAMGRHNTDVGLVEAACSALWSLSMEGNVFSRYAPVCLFTPNYTDSRFILKTQLNQLLMYSIDGFL